MSDVCVCAHIWPVLRLTTRAAARTVSERSVAGKGGPNEAKTATEAIASYCSRPQPWSFCFFADRLRRSTSGEAHVGNPPTLQPERCIYLDADTACKAVSPVFSRMHAEERSETIGPRMTHRSTANAVFDVRVLVRVCEVGQTIATLHTVSCGWQQANVLWSARGQRIDKASLRRGPAENKGPCREWALTAGTNPINAVHGNKYQSEPVYRAATGGLELVLHYNSRQGSTYFQKGPFGAGWRMRYLAAVRPTFRASPWRFVPAEPNTSSMARLRPAIPFSRRTPISTTGSSASSMARVR